MQFFISILLIASFLIIEPAWAAESASNSDSSTQARVTLKWLGNAGWEIQAGTNTILIDPFLTRKEATAGKEWKTDEEAVLKVITGADYIFAGHSHADHIGDIPFIASASAPKSSAPEQPRISP